MPRTFSGKQVIRILEKEFDFTWISQTGSHVKMRRLSSGKVITTIVPLHTELAFGTFKGVLDLAQLKVRDFMDRA